MSQKETPGPSEMKPPPTTSVMQPRPSAAPLPRTPWMSHVVHGRPPMWNRPPFYHMIHVPSPMAIVNTPSMFMPPPPNIQHHGGDGAVSVAGCVNPNCQARATLPSIRASEDSSEAIKTTASCSASGPITHDVAFLKFQKNAQLHGIKISATKEKNEQSGSPVGGRLSVASPEFTPHGVYLGSGKTCALPESHLLPDVIVVSSEDDEDLLIDENREDAISHSKVDEDLELQAMGVPLTVNGADNCVDYSDTFLSSELLEVEDQVSPFAPAMQLHSDGDVFCIDGAMYTKCRQTVSASTQTDFTIVENVRPEMIDEWTSTEELKNSCDQETNTELAAVVTADAAVTAAFDAAVAVTAADDAVAASVTENDSLKQSHSTNEKSEISVNVSESCYVKVASLDTIDDSTSEEEMDLPREGKVPEIAVKSKTNYLASEASLLLVKQEHSDNLVHQSSDVSEKQEGQNIARISKANSLTSNTSSNIVLEELNFVLEQNGVGGELERWERAEKCKTNGITSSTSSIVDRKESHDGICHQPSDLRDECRRRNVAAVEAVCEMFETDKVASDADRATDSVNKVDNYLNTLTEFNIKCPEVSQPRGLEVYSRLETALASAFCEDRVLGGSASSTTQLNKLPGSEERNDLSNILSRSGRSSVDNCSMADIRRQQKGPSSIHSNASARQNQRTSSRNICLDEAAGASLQETISASKNASIKGRDDVSRSDSDALQKAYNACLENMDFKKPYSSLLEDDCRRNVMASADDDSLSGSENMSVAMSVCGAELKSDCSRMANSMSRIGSAEPTELMDLIKNQLLTCDPSLANNPQMLETLAVQQLCLMHQEQMVFSQVMEAMRQQPQQLLMLQQHAAQQALTPQQLLLQQQLVAQQQQQLVAQQQQHLVAQQQQQLVAQQQQQLAAQQQLAQPHLLPAQPFVMLPQTSKPQQTLPPRFAARLPTQGSSCTEMPANVHSSIPETSHRLAFTSSSAFRMGMFAEDSEPQKRSSQDYDLNQNRVESRTVKNQESVIKATDYKQQEKSVNSMTKSVLDIKDNSLTTSAGNGLSAVSPASQGKRASSVSSKASAGFRPNVERSESEVTSPAVSSRSAACAQQPESSASVARSGSGKPSGVFDRKTTDVCGDKKSFFNSIGIDAEFAPTVPGSSVTKPSYGSSAFASEKTRLTVSETAESKAADHSFSARGRGSFGGAGVRPKSVAKIDNIGNGASSDGCPRSLRSQEPSQDPVKFSKGGYGKEKLPEFKRSTEGPVARGSATDKFAMGEDCMKNRKGVEKTEKPVARSRWTEGPYRRTTTQETEEDWAEAGGVSWIKDPLHYGPPKCSASSRLKPKTEEW